MKLSIILCLICGAVSVHAQQPSPTPELPSLPLLKPVPDRTKWTVTVKGKPAGKGNVANDGQSGTIHTIIGAKTDNILHVISIAGNGNKSDTWSDGKVQVIINPAWKKPLISSGSPQEFPKPDWISLKNYTDTLKKDGRDYLVFRDRIFPAGGDQSLTAADLDGVDPETLKVTAVASIDAETRLPVSVQIGDETTIYKFETLPSGVMQTFPSNVQSVITAQNEKLKAATRKPARP
jgi:hypothetical protein